MPTVLRLDGLRVVIYPDDHRPAHVHVIGAGGEAVFILNCPDGPPRLREVNGFSRRIVARIQNDLAAQLAPFSQHGERFVEIFEQTFQAAIKRGEELRKNGYAVSAEYDTHQNRLVMGFTSGVIIMVPVHLMQELAKADPAALGEIEIAPSGLALHWPYLDADVYVPSLMQGVFGTKRWTAAQLNAAGGRTTTLAKAAAARQNGAKGERPRKYA